MELPTIIFTALLAIVGAMWLLSLVGAMDVEADPGEGLLDDVLEPLDLAGVPTIILLTIIGLAGWFVSVLASIFLLDGRSGGTLVLLAIVVGVGAAVIALAITSWAGPKLALLFRTERAPSKQDLIGRTVEIRSATVNESSGRGEATWPDGTSSTVDIRTSPNGGVAAGELARGDRALLIDWNEATDDFIVDHLPPELSE